MAWNAGYVADVAYIANYNAAMSPGWISMAALAAGQIPPDISQGYRYLDLGCGYATTLLPLAAANPHAEFVGIDFMPEHVAFAHRVIRRTGLQNAKVLEASFGDIVRNPNLLGEPFDFIAMHGVYTWVSTETRKEILDILQRHLKPGGILYAGYNSHPGWTNAIPLQHLIRIIAQQHHGSSIEKIYAAVRYIARLQEAGSPILKEVDLPPAIKKALANPDALEPRVAAYMAHEYLNEHWNPMFVADMCQDMATVKLSFIGTSRMIELSENTGWSEAQKKLIAEFKNPVASESIKEMLIASGFRRDLFARGPSAMPLQLQNETLENIRFALITPLAEIKPEFSFRKFAVEIKAELAKALATALVNGPKSVAEIMAEIPEELLTTNALGIAAVLMDVGIAKPLTNAQKRMSKAVDFNMAYIAESQLTMPNSMIGLASPVLGAARPVPMNLVIAYQWLARGRPDLDGFPEEIVKLADMWEPIFRGLEML